MSVRFDLTVIAPELCDAVIYMDNSPAYAAFKEETEELLADLKAEGRLSSIPTFDEKDLTAKMEDTLKNMQRSFMIWSFREEQLSGADPDSSTKSVIRLFFKSQQDKIIALNGGGETVACESVCGLIESFKSEIRSDPALYTSVKDFFRGYVYGCKFNYLKEAVIMKKYAEMTAYLGVMAGVIGSAPSQKQKVVGKMAPLLVNDRFKYLTGFVPKSLMMDIIFDRIEFSPLPESEAALIKQRIDEYISANYRTETDDEGVYLGDDVTSGFACVYFGGYISASSLGNDVFNKCMSGTRTFLDGDREDQGDYSAEKITAIISAKCAADHNSFYTSDKAPCNDVSLGGSDLCLKYPLVFKDGSDYRFAPVYEELIYPVLDREIYIPAEIPSGMFPFADEVFTSNAVRRLFGIADTSAVIRRDRQVVAEQLKRLVSDVLLSEEDKKMLCLEQMLCLVSGNLSADEYEAFVRTNVFDSGLITDYIRYRLRLIDSSGRDSNKLLLDAVNKL